MGPDNTSVGPEEIDHRFGLHAAAIEGDGATKQDHADLRVQFKHFANYIDGLLPAGREKSLAMTQLEDASMWAHKAMARQNDLVEES